MGSAERSSGRPPLSRSATLRQVMECIENDERANLTLPDLYASANVSPRTLRTMFIDMFGVTPSSYLRLRRLHRLGAALLMTNASLSTVAGLCEQFHLSDHGRAARDYRALFGEFPSQTLARSPTAHAHPEVETARPSATPPAARTGSTPHT